MAITIPGVRNSNGATTADILVEQIMLCEANIENIREVARYRPERERRDEIRGRLRTCHDFLGMAGSRKQGCLYRERAIPEGAKVMCEHAIPVTILSDLYDAGVPFADLIFYPVALITKESDKRMGKLGLTKKGHTLRSPLIRYHTADILIETHEGVHIDASQWTIRDHWALIDKTKAMADIRREVQEKLVEWRASVLGS